MKILYTPINNQTRFYLLSKKAFRSLFAKYEELISASFYPGVYCFQVGGFWEPNKNVALSIHYRSGNYQLFGAYEIDTPNLLYLEVYATMIRPSTQNLDKFYHQLMPQILEFIDTSLSEKILFIDHELLIGYDEKNQLQILKMVH
jgi:hypothetical protein